MIDRDFWELLCKIFCKDVICMLLCTFFCTWLLIAYGQEVQSNEKKRIQTKQDAIDLVQEQHRLNKEKWLTWEVAEKYHRRACALKMPTNEIKGETRELILELMR